MRVRLQHDVGMGVPNHETRLSVVQDLVAFRLATCLLLKITFGGETVAIMSQCGRGQSMCRLGGVGTAAAQCWVGVTMGVPSGEHSILIGQDLVRFRLAQCFFLSLVAAVIVLLDTDQAENMSQ